MMNLQMKQISGLLTALRTPFTVSETAPENPVENEVWLEPSSLSLFIYMVGENSSAWVEII
jgi:hypothetical protein